MSRPFNFVGTSSWLATTAMKPLVVVLEDESDSNRPNPEREADHAPQSKTIDNSEKEADQYEDQTKSHCDQACESHACEFQTGSPMPASTMSLLIIARHLADNSLPYWTTSACPLIVQNLLERYESQWLCSSLAESIILRPVVVPVVISNAVVTTPSSPVPLWSGSSPGQFPTYGLTRRRSIEGMTGESGPQLAVTQSKGSR